MNYVSQVLKKIKLCFCFLGKLVLELTYFFRVWGREEALQRGEKVHR